jgi:hypothetical protein
MHAFKKTDSETSSTHWFVVGRSRVFRPLLPTNSASSLAPLWAHKRCSCGAPKRLRTVSTRPLHLAEQQFGNGSIIEQTISLYRLDPPDP